MWLAISVGNTNIASALVADGRLAGPRRVHPWRSLGSSDLSAGVERILDEDATTGEIDGLVLASVVPGAGETFARLAERRGLPIIEAGPSTVPIPIRLDSPGGIGADRLVNAYAAARLHGAPAIVVDLGTATTIDAIGADGAFLGGAIAPGAQLGLDALADRTALLPHVEIAPVDRAIGSDTIAAMRSGAVFGHVGLVRELVERIRAELAAESGARSIRTIATGGHSTSSWAADLAVDVVDPDLTLAGLALLQSDRAAADSGPGRPMRRTDRSARGGEAADAA